MISLEDYKKMTRLAVREDKLYHRFGNDEIYWEKHSEMNFDLSNAGCCVICFESNPLVLEQHHIGGRNNAKATVSLCSNHHRILSTRQTSWSKPWTGKDNHDDLKFLFLFLGLTQLTELNYKSPLAPIVLLMVAHTIHTNEKKKVSIFWIFSLTFSFFLLTLFKGDRK